MSNFVVGLLVYVAVFFDRRPRCDRPWLMALVVVSATLYLPYTSAADVTASRDAKGDV